LRQGRRPTRERKGGQREGGRTKSREGEMSSGEMTPVSLGPGRGRWDEFLGEAGLAG
jgi:hypothetical protein